MKNHTLIIAEAGVNHNGDIRLAKQLIDVAAEAGADLVKFQTFKASNLTTAAAIKADYQKQDSNQLETQREMLSKLELTHDMHKELIKHCEKREIGFLSSGFDIESVRYINSLGMELVKIPSGEITNYPYLLYIGNLKGRVILSTGMASMEDVKSAINVLEEAGTHRSNITVLHCTTEYPTPMEEVNLNAMLSIRNEFNVAVGYSDHTQGIEVAIAAVAMGASVIEKHFTINRNLPGPDHKASLEPNELMMMVSSIRNIERALGDGVKQATLSEKKNIAVARKSLVAMHDIAEGEYFTEKNLTTKRPGTGVSPMHWSNVIGTKASRDFKVDELIEGPFK